MSKTNVTLILAYGPRIGQSIASIFSQKGFKVAIVGRSLTDGTSDEGHLTIQGDMEDPSRVPLIFQTVERELGPPNVVVYNGALRLTTPPEDPFVASLTDFERCRKIGFESAYMAAKESLRVFKSLDESAIKAFIYTGNVLNQIGIAGVMPFTHSKISAASMIEYAANAYGDKGFRFYYADQRLPDGRPAGQHLDGAAHAKLYWELANEGAQSKWQVTFTNNGRQDDLPALDFRGNPRFK